MYDERTNLGQQVARDVREFFKEKVSTSTVIPRNVRLGEAPSHGMPGDPVRREVARRRSLPRARARSARARPAPPPTSTEPTAMVEKRPALGKGSSALIPDAPRRTSPRARSRSTSISSARIEFQPRDARGRRAARGAGAVDPRQRHHPADRRPPRRRAAIEIIAGERRWRAAQRAGLLKVPVVVRDDPPTRNALLEIALSRTSSARI